MKFKRKNKNNNNNVSTPSGFATPSLRERVGVRWLSPLWVVVGLLMLSLSLNAQVTIGSDKAPLPGALLMLDDNTTGSSGENSSKGLGLPRVALQSASGDLGQSLNAAVTTTSTLDKDAHIGLLVYNTNPIETVNRLCPGLHVWDGDKWSPIVPYPAIQKERELEFDKLIGFTHIDPANSADPNFSKWAELGKDPANHQLGYLGTVADDRTTPVVNYHHTRYYVGVANRQKTYKVKTSYSCNPNNPNWGAPVIETDPPYDVFEDGVWMNENLRAEQMDPRRDNIGETVVTLTGDFYGVAPNDATIAAWGYSNMDANNKDTYGLLYTWAAATNDKATNMTETGLNEGLQIQGICLSGWHLPSDREITDLENGIILHTDLFSSSPVIGTMIPYTTKTTNAIGKHGKAMRPTSTGVNDDRGTSKLPEEGGFNLMLAGRAYSGAIANFDWYGFLWSSSTGGKEVSWYRDLYQYDQGVRRYISNRDLQYSVRCKRN